MPLPELTWQITRGPWYDNNLATLELTSEGMHDVVVAGEVVGDRHDAPSCVGWPRSTSAPDR